MIFFLSIGTAWHSERHPSRTARRRPVSGPSRRTIILTMSLNCSRVMPEPIIITRKPMIPQLIDWLIDWLIAMLFFDRLLEFFF